MNTIDLNDISLEQALIDFEVANARVIDLTQRLTSMNRELITARTDLETYKIRSRDEAAALRAELATVSYDLQHLREHVALLQRSKSFRLLRLLGRVRAEVWK